jgi:hypothetical protein
MPTVSPFSQQKSFNAKPLSRKGIEQPQRKAPIRKGGLINWWYAHGFANCLADRPPENNY